MDRSNSRPLYLGFASQKGGVGKSTLAEVLALSLIHISLAQPYMQFGLSSFSKNADSWIINTSSRQVEIAMLPTNS